MIELRSVHKTYQVKGAAVVALKEIDLTVESGEIFGIIGHSGAGKSTLLRMINFLERPSSGTVRVDGVDLQRLDDASLRRFRQSVGMIFQHFNLVGSKTVGQNVAFPLKIAGQADGRQIAERVDELLELVGLRRHKDKYPRQLSGGEKQRVGIARALANHPRVLLCDEATSALDPQTTRSILQLLRQINEKLGLTIVLITHEMDVIRTVCDRVAVIDSGTIVESGPVSTVFLHPRHQTTRRFVQEAEHTHGEEIDAGLAGNGARTLCRLTFMQDTVHQPILSQTARALGIDFSILGGRIERIKSMTCGQMTVALEGPSERVRDAITRLAATGVTVEELRG
jgi:D-methionine transport system ATP-binding protein